VRQRLALDHSAVEPTGLRHEKRRYAGSTNRRQPKEPCDESLHRGPLGLDRAE
jgi:hypothetical protein